METVFADSQPFLFERPSSSGSPGLLSSTVRGTIEWPYTSTITVKTKPEATAIMPQISEPVSESFGDLNPINTEVKLEAPAVPLLTPGPSVQEELQCAPKKAKKTTSFRKPKLPRREESAEAVLDLGSLKTLGEYNKDLLQSSSVCRTDLALLHHVFKHSRKLVVVTGAGISVSAGIPDFRSTTGLFTMLKNDLKLKASGKQMFDASVVYNDLTSTHNFHTTVCDLHKLCSSSKATPFHECINEISKDNRLLRLYTQNIDCLDTSLSHLSTKTPLEAPWPQAVQLHGTIKSMNCSKCNWTGDFDPKVFDGCESVPECPECLELEGVRTIAGKRPQGIGRLRPKIVLYNEFNPDADAIGQVTEADLTSKPDGLIVVGTTLKIPGVRRIVREMSQAVHAAKGATVWMNIDDPPQISKREFEGCFDLIVKGDCQIVPQLLKDFETEKRELEERKIQERKAKAEAREAAKVLRQKQALERAKRKLLAPLKVTKKRAPAKACRTTSEGSNIKTKPAPKLAQRSKSLGSETENLIIVRKEPELVATTSSSSSSSDYSLSDSSRDPSPQPEVYDSTCISIHPQSAYIPLIMPSQPKETPIPTNKRRTLGVLKKKSVNTTQPNKTGLVTKSKVTKASP